MKWAFSRREHAAGLLRAALPPALAAAVQWSTLRLEKQSYVDRALRGRHSDLVMSARIGRERRCYFYALIEHQRHVEALMIFRFGVYMMRHWEHLVADTPRITELPPIVPLLIHHSDTGWTAATRFEDIVACDGAVRDELLPHIPHFGVRLIDLSHGRASTIVEEALTALGRFVLWCLSVAGDDARLEDEMARMAAVLDELLAAPDGSAAFEVLLRYLSATHPRVRVEKVGRLLLKTAGPKAQEKVVGFVEELEQRGKRIGLREGRREGRQEGRQEGRREGRREGEREGRAKTLLELLAVRFGKVPDAVAARIQGATGAQLARWTVRVLTAQTITEVLDKGNRPPSRARKPAARPRASTARPRASTARKR